MPIRSLAYKIQKGVTLIEVLVALLVLSIGLLGVASLQLYGLRYNQSAYLRSQATILAYDIVDRMRTNNNGSASGFYDSISTNSLPADPACISTTTGCNNQELANHDIREWGSYFTQTIPMLPSSVGTVSKAGDTFTVTITWTELEKTGTVNQSLNYKFQL